MKKVTIILGMLLALVVVVNAQTKVEIKKADLPKAITDNIAKDYAGYDIQNAFKMAKDNQNTFEVIVTKGADKEKLEYSAAGAFIKKEAIKAVASNKPAAKQNEKNQKPTEQKNK